MGDLPSCRVTAPKFPFQHTGVVLFGPYMIKSGRSVVKRWGVLFICMASRACHLDVVPDLSTDSFIQCYTRFIARRGSCCRYLYSDQGTNFKGCDSEFKSLLKATPAITTAHHDYSNVDNDKLSQCMLHKGVDVVWKFNVAKNPHAGGGWERAIRTVKNVFSCMLYNGLNGLPAMKTRSPNDFEFITILCEIEAILNCRPITKLSNNVEDWRVLSPISILTGNLHPDSPVHVFNKGDMYRSNYKYVNAVAEQFWKRWLLMYVPWLQIRHKWCESSPNIRKGDLVLLLESVTEGRRNYPKALVVETFPDSRERARRLKLKLSNGRVITRDVRSVVHLEGFDNTD